MFYNELYSVPAGSVDIPSPDNIPSDTQAPSFEFKDVQLKRQNTKLYSCSASSTLVWDWKSGGCIYSNCSSEILDFGDYWVEPPVDEKLNLNDPVLKGNVLLMVQFKARKNYAHFVLECLPKFFYFKKYLDVVDFDYYIVDGAMKEIFFHFSKIFNFKGTPVFIDRAGSLRCENLFFTSALHHPLNRIEPQMVHYYQEVIRGGCEIDHEKRRRIFIDRVDGSRGIINREAVESLLNYYDFEVVNFDEMDIQNQIEIVNSSCVIAGIHGAAFANLVFANLTRKTSCIEIIPKSFGMQSYWFLANGLGMKYYPVWPVGGWNAKKIPNTRFENIDVDIELLEVSIKLAIKSF